MQTEFKRAVLQRDLRKLCAFDRKVFPPSDVFPADQWKEYESYWMILDGITVGCCAFQQHVDFREDTSRDGVNPRLKGSLYITSTGILPKYQGAGLGRLFKSWQVAYARHHGFHRIVTNSRKHNARIIALNRAFGFRTLRITPGYYSGPTDSTVVMELRIGTRAAAGSRLLYSG